MTDPAHIGLKRGTVQLAKYNPAWPQLFVEEKQRLLTALNGKIYAIEHVGSTSVPGLAAKPIIDMIASVDNLFINEDVIKQLQALGYEFMPERVFADRVFFPKGPQDNRTHHLSLVIKDGPGWRDPIRFRNFLATHSQTRDIYQMFKQELAQKYTNDRASYTIEKEVMIQKIMQEARK